MGCYLKPDDVSTIESIVVTILKCPCGNNIMVARYFNVDSTSLEGTAQKEDIAAELAEMGLQDMLEIFSCTKKHWHEMSGPGTWCTWVRRCVPVLIVFLGRTCVSLGTYPSRTHGTNWTII